MSKFILLQTLLHICSGHETTLLRAAKDPQLDRLDKLATSVNQLETTTSSNVQQNVASSSIDPSTTRFQTTEMNVQDAKEIKDRIQATRTKLQQVETKIQDYKLKSKETTSSSTSQEKNTEVKNTVSDDDKQNSAAKLSDAPSDRPLHNSETVQSVEREADHAVHELNRFGNSRKTQIASVPPTAGVARSVSVSQSNPSNPMNPSVASAASASVPSNAAAAVTAAASAARTTAATQAPVQTPTSFAASIPPIEAGELEFPQFPEAGTSQATRQDDASTEDAWAETDAMAERMSEGGGGSMGAQFMPPNQQQHQQQQMDPRMMQQ